MAKTVLTKDIIVAIKKRLDEMEGKEVEPGALVQVGGELSDEQLGSITGGTHISVYIPYVTN